MPDLESEGDLTIGGDVVGRDKIVSNVANTTSHHTVETNITVGDITHSTGVAIGPNAQALVTQGGAPASALTITFAPILDKVRGLPEGPAKSVAQQAAAGLLTEAEKGPAADEKAVSEWLRVLAQLAPDVWDAAVAAFTSPVTGLSPIFPKIAAQTRADNAVRPDAGS